MQQEHEGDQRHDDTFLQQGRPQGLDGRQDQVGPVIDRDDLHPLGQALRDGLDLGLGIVDHVERIGAHPLQHDAAGDLALAIQLSDAPALVGHDLDPRHIAQKDRDAAFGADRDHLQIGDAVQIAAPAHHELELRQLDRAPAGVHVAGRNRLADLGQGDAKRPHPHRIDGDRVLLHEAADAGDFRHAIGTADGKAHHPVLQGPQLGKAQVLALQRVLIDPAHARRIRPKRGRHPVRQTRCGGVEVFQHAGPRPVGVHAVLEDDVDEGDAEERKPPHHP